MIQYILHIIKINRFLFFKFVWNNWNKKCVFTSEYYIYIVFKNFWKKTFILDSYTRRLISSFLGQIFCYDENLLQLQVFVTR